ncbi:MAG: Holliday junction DNA helicase RuvA [Bacteroidetes bacterium GWA2_32_17]|nr:MAG: Holliday junction DNA helicase RuvA [Bacteroidetes bacterium GWA2_32_17]
MYEYLTGKISELTPAYAVVENNGIGYIVNISLNTYSKLNSNNTCTLFLHHVVREDAELFFGFFSKQEREIFRQLISVSGVGPNTARMMLSSLSSEEIQKAIMSGNVIQLKSIKGIGQKTAERIIVDLRDKIAKVEGVGENFGISHNTIRQEALSALLMLGFQRNNTEKTIDKLLLQNSALSAEEIVKLALKQL